MLHALEMAKSLFEEVSGLNVFSLFSLVSQLQIYRVRFIDFIDFPSTCAHLFCDLHRTVTAAENFPRNIKTP